MDDKISSDQHGLWLLLPLGGKANGPNVEMLTNLAHYWLAPTHPRGIEPMSGGWVVIPFTIHESYNFLDSWILKGYYAP